MNKSFLALLSLLSLLSLTVTSTAHAQPTGAEVAEQTQPAVVAVISRQAVETRLGSGFFISPTLVVTNKQFLDNDAKITLADASGRRIKTEEVVGVSADYDLALIRVAKSERAHLKVSNRSVVKDQAIFLVGAPLRGKSTFSVGKIVEVGGTGALMSITAKVSQRNSGAPVLDDGGYVIGVATRTPSMSGDVHMAVPADHLSDLLEIYEAEKGADGSVTLTKDGAASNGTATSNDTAANGTATNGTATSNGTGATNGEGTASASSGTGASTTSGAIKVSATEKEWLVVSAADRNLQDEARRAAIICGYNPQTQTYGCDPNQLRGFSVRSEVQVLAPAATAQRNAQADLLYDQRGCASHLRVRIGSPTTTSVVDWSRANFIVSGRAVTAVQSLQAVGVRLEAPAGAVSEETLAGGSVPCLLPVEATAGPSLSFRVPVKFGESEEVLQWDFRRQYQRSDVTEYALLRMLPAPPPVADPGAAPVMPEEGGLTAPLVGAGLGAAFPTVVAAVIGGVLVAAALNDGTDPTNQVLILAIVGGGAAMAGAIGGLFIGLFASRGNDDEVAERATAHRQRLTAWEAQRQAYRRRRAYDRALQGLHQGAAAPQVREVPVVTPPPPAQ